MKEDKQDCLTQMRYGLAAKVLIGHLCVHGALV